MTGEIRFFIHACCTGVDLNIPRSENVLKIQGFTRLTRNDVIVIDGKLPSWRDSPPKKLCCSGCKPQGQVLLVGVDDIKLLKSTDSGGGGESKLVFTGASILVGEKQLYPLHWSTHNFHLELILNCVAV